MAARERMAEVLKRWVGEERLRLEPDFEKGVVLSAEVPRDVLREVMRTFETEGYYLESLTGLDFKDTLELVYHMNRYEPSARIALRVPVPRGESVPTMSDVYRSALWLEREAWEFFGIAFTGHPDLRPLLLPEDADFHPHRKDFGRVHAHRRREEIYG